MDICDSMSSPDYMLIEQVAPQIFNILPEFGPIMVMMDKQGNFWPNNCEEFSKLNISKPFFRELCAKVDDGAEPVVTQVNDVNITAAQLATERTNYVYVFIFLPQYNLESALINIDLIEILLNQTTLITDLVEENNHLRELQMKLHSLYCKSDKPSN